MGSDIYCSLMQNQSVSLCLLCFAWIGFLCFTQIGLYLHHTGPQPAHFACNYFPVSLKTIHRAYFDEGCRTCLAVWIQLQECSILVCGLPCIICYPFFISVNVAIGQIVYKMNCIQCSHLGLGYTYIGSVWSVQYVCILCKV